MTGHRLGILQAVVATWLFSFVAPVAKLVPLGSGAISFWRALFTMLALLAIASSTKRGGLRARSRHDAFTLIATGIFTAGNWYFFVRAAQVSTVAVAVVVLFTYPLFTALTEPWIFHERLGWGNAAAGAFVVLGVLWLVPKPTLDDSTALGALYALIASLSLTARNLMSRRAVQSYAATTVILYQMIACAIVFAPAAAHDFAITSWHDIWLLLLLGAGFTAASQALFIASFRHLTTAFSSLIVSLQPVYTTLIAVVLLDEVPRARTVFGGGIIVAAVMVAIAMDARSARR